MVAPTDAAPQPTRAAAPSSEGSGNNSGSDKVVIGVAVAVSVVLVLTLACLAVVVRRRFQARRQHRRPAGAPARTEDGVAAGEEVPLPAPAMVHGGGEHGVYHGTYPRVGGSNARF
jgi:hypothetical protein